MCLKYISSWAKEDNGWEFTQDCPYETGSLKFPEEWNQQIFFQGPVMAK